MIGHSCRGGGAGTCPAWSGVAPQHCCSPFCPTHRQTPGASRPSDPKPCGGACLWCIQTQRPTPCGGACLWCIQTQRPQTVRWCVPVVHPDPTTANPHRAVVRACGASRPSNPKPCDGACLWCIQTQRQLTHTVRWCVPVVHPDPTTANPHRAVVRACGVSRHNDS